MAFYTGKIILVSLGCLILLSLASRLLQNLDWRGVFYICALMSANGWLSLVPFYMVKWENPLRAFVIGAVIRNLVLGIAISFYYYHLVKFGRDFLIYCMITFIIFQALEIYQLNREKNLFSVRK